MLSDLAVFVKQEAQHCKAAQRLQRAPARVGYPGLEVLERFVRHLDRFLETRSLKFNLAYSDGFEAMGALGAQLWFNCYVEYLEARTPRRSTCGSGTCRGARSTASGLPGLSAPLWPQAAFLDGWLYRVWASSTPSAPLASATAPRLPAGGGPQADAPEEREASVDREKAFREDVQGRHPRAAECVALLRSKHTVKPAA